MEGLLLFEPKTYSDNRGYFRETFRLEELNRISGVKFEFVQGNESLSIEAGTIRGLHFQAYPHAQDKLVSVYCGSVCDVVVDLRPDSKTYLQWKSFELSAENGRKIFIPKGFAHGFCTLMKNTVLSYMVTDYYAPETEGGIKWDDGDLKIDWPLNGCKPIVSDKDTQLPSLSEIVKNIKV